MKLVTEPQMSLLIRLNGGQKVELTDVHTITLTSSTRRGYVKPLKRVLKITPLGKQVYEFNHRRRYSAWKKDLEIARNMKRRAS